MMVLLYHFVCADRDNSSCSNQFCVDRLTGELILVKTLVRYNYRHTSSQPFLHIPRSPSHTPHTPLTHTLLTHPPHSPAHTPHSPSHTPHTPLTHTSHTPSHTLTPLTHTPDSPSHTPHTHSWLTLTHPSHTLTYPSYTPYSPSHTQDHEASESHLLTLAITNSPILKFNVSIHQP